MSIWAVIPVKPFQSGKSRMSELLEAPQRDALNRRLLVHTLETLQEVAAIQRILVVSRDPAALELAEGHHAEPICEAHADDLNSALEQAGLRAKTTAVASLLVIPTDLPGIRPEVVAKFIEQQPDPPSVVIAPDRHRRGTNALLLSPPGVIPFEFGSNSFQKHCESAQRLGAVLVVFENYRLALDLDERDDLLVAAAPLMNEDIIQTILPSDLD